ncbi:heterokaryon incompatibility protein-domain-containing protein [Annulohypoxylon truncatum]|uniref:heterokaryon incompatibility protein-domain-containing protein n=1 Tax=Annulohypoxylon truncatum TaxID=327061 RepID=UPI00200807A5|nr:heterokaryon incompatibility protein-domain-containing protein [Annulohypoxylon truncatum]KAI1208566.1 heterokaryon incompatibility protein-domain-containing protein [Annulohypoxylon truncatum]
MVWNFLVTPNCHDALRHLRFRFSRRKVWIDAICIDQRDNDRATRERNAQVQMMGDIYENASRVIIWLGLAHPPTPRVFRLIRIVGLTEYCQERYKFAQIPAKPAFEEFSRRLQAKDDKSRRYIEGLRYLLENRWFSRVWTMQEVVFARKCVILSGDSQLYWELFNLTVGDIDNSIADSEPILLTISRSVTGTQIQRHKKAVATGLELPDVDYNKSVQEAYGDIAKSFIKTHGRQLFPIWTPNWKMAHMPGPDIVDNTGNFPFEGKNFRASGDNLASIPSFTPTEELRVIVVGDVRSIVVSHTAGGQPDVVGRKAFSLNFVRACHDWFVWLSSVWEIETYQGEGVLIEALTNTAAFHKIFEAGEDIDPEECKQLEAQFHCWTDVFM